MYKKVNESLIQHIPSEKFIPKDPSNMDYQEFLAWEAAGNTIQPADEVQS